MHSLVIIRCGIAFLAFTGTSRAARASLKILPRDHPGRTYALGRTEIGHERVALGMSKLATLRYLVGGD